MWTIWDVRDTYTINQNEEYAIKVHFIMLTIKHKM